MNAELISVGTELLLGEILNSDAKYLSEELAMLGINLYYQTVVGDNIGRLEDTLGLSLSRSDIVITSGGLGPTDDDLTKEVIARAFGKELILDEVSLKRIKDYYASQNREMPRSNIKQAMLPKGAIILENNHGTAPGCIIEDGDKTVIMLPGPPDELTKMFSESVKPYLLKKSQGAIYQKTLKLFGIGESKAAEMLKDLMDNNDGFTLAPYAETAGVRLRLAAYAKEKDEAEKILNNAKERIFERLGEYIYSQEDKSLPETVVEILIDKNLKISAAESCTGGMFTKMIVDIPGSSEILDESVVTYSNNAKEKYLNVKKETLNNYGAVSEETAKEMAEGIQKAAKSNIGVGITGIAGPGGGTKDKPQGLVYVAVKCEDELFVRKLLLKGSREKVRYTACLNAFDMILKAYKK